MNLRKLSSAFAASVAIGGAVVLTWPSAARASPELDTLCPGAEAALQHELAGAWLIVREPGDVRVQLRVDGDRITRIIASSLSSSYRDAVRKAVRHLRCTSGGEPSQSVEFEIAFVGPETMPLTQRVARTRR